MNTNPSPRRQPTYRYQTGPVRNGQSSQGTGCIGALGGFVIGGSVIGGMAFELLHDENARSGMFIDGGEIAAMFWATIIGLVGGLVLAAVIGGRRR